MKKNTIVSLLTIGVLLAASSTLAGAGKISNGIVQAAKDQIRKGDSSTSCSLYLRRVLNRAGYPFRDFMANDFNSAMQKNLPNWSQQAFSVAKNGRTSLRRFLNSAPDQAAFLAQWPRKGRSGHVAIIVKESSDRYRIYQAQLGLAKAHSKRATIENLLYAPNSYGNRSNLRLFFPADLFVN